MATRLTRPERKLQTRERLLETARELFLKRGFAATSLENIADAAGLTKGAVYSNFSSKDDLFLALYAARVDERVQDVEAAGEQNTFEEATRANARHIAARQRREPQWHALLLEFTTYALRRPELRRRIAKEHRRLVDAIAATMDRAAERGGGGIRIEQDLDPDHTPADLIETAMDLLLRAAITPARSSSRGAHR